MRIHNPPGPAREIPILAVPQRSIVSSSGWLIPGIEDLCRRWTALERQLRKTGHGVYATPAVACDGGSSLIWEIRDCRRNPTYLKGQPVWLSVRRDYRRWTLHWRYAAGGFDCVHGVTQAQLRTYLAQVLPGARVPVVSGLSAAPSYALRRLGTAVQAARGTWRYVSDAHS